MNSYYHDLFIISHSHISVSLLSYWNARLISAMAKVVGDLMKQPATLLSNHTLLFFIHD